MVAKIILTADEKSYVIAEFQKGRFIKDLAVELGMWDGVIKRTLREAGIRVKKYDVTPEQIANLLALYKTKSLDELEQETGIIRCALTRILRANGALIRRRGKVQKYFIVNGKKVCAACGIEKICTEFSLHSASHDGLQPSCKICQNISHRRYLVKKKFGLTEADYAAILDAQNNLCAICGEPETRMKFGKVTRLAIDHNHTTGNVRELLCSSCNLVLGKIKENPDTCDKIKAYILKHTIGGNQK